MPFMPATPAQVDGQLDDSEVIVLAISGPYMGMALAAKADHPALDEAVSHKEVLPLQGTDILPSASQIHVALKNPDGTPVSDPVSSYPRVVRFHITGTLLPGDPPTHAAVVVENDLRTLSPWIPLVADTAPGTFYFDYTFEQPGYFHTRTDLNTGDTGTATANLHPAV